ncbi:MAG TPA: sensor domain-containing diguanylate cyclase, partial [Cellvibrionaceae bacterium]|nr:sensor domain-containing diguanylate cyclase [Cellvibrionaceae bacterium]
FFGAAVGIEYRDLSTLERSREVSFCAHAITQDEVMVVADASCDERFFDNPLVTGNAQVRFYAGVPLRSPEGHALGALCILDTKPHPEFSTADAKRLAELAKMASDRLELRRIEVASTRFRPPFASYAANLPSAVIWFDEHLQLLEWNQPAADFLGFPLEAKPGLTFDALLAPGARAGFRRLIADACAQASLEQVHFPEELTVLGAHGQEIPIGLVLLGWREAGRMTFEVIFKDTSHEPTHTGLDDLTGLANRGTFYRRVENHLLQSPPDGAVLVIDLDGFKDLNDTLGQGLGDDILRAVAERLSQSVDSGTLVARLGADEFAVLHPQPLTPAAALSLAQHLTLALTQPLSLRGQDVRISACCGLALAPQQAQEAIELVSNADLALFKAKTCGPGRTQLFDPNLRQEAVTRRLYGLELHRAVDKGEFLLFYQP